MLGTAWRYEVLGRSGCVQACEAQKCGWRGTELGAWERWQCDSCIGPLGSGDAGAPTFKPTGTSKCRYLPRGRSNV
eukprot:365535-Chlamydomonas_euryale.AAC.71